MGNDPVDFEYCACCFNNTSGGCCGRNVDGTRSIGAEIGRCFGRGLLSLFSSSSSNDGSIDAMLAVRSRIRGVVSRGEQLMGVRMLDECSKSVSAKCVVSVLLRNFI